MRLSAALLASLIFPCTVFAFPVGGYFQQGIIVDNTSSQSIMISDATAPSLQNYLLEANHTLQGTFDSDQLTNGAGQTFSHTISIHSANDYALICTVQSDIVLATNNMHVGKPSSTNETRCKTSNLISSSTNGLVISTEITVA